MTTYRYVALGPSGKRESGEIAAASLQAAEAMLAERQLYPTRVEKVGVTGTDKAKSSLFTKRIKPVSVDEVCELLRAIAVMGSAGVSLVEALQAVQENAPSVGLQNLAKALRNDVLSGRSLSASMAQHPAAFPEVVVDMVSVADEGGRLAESVQSAIDYLDRSNTVKKNIISALVYPGILMGASGVAFLLLIVVILPTFGEAFSSLGVQLPWFTQMLLDIGNAIRGNLLLTIGFVVGGAFGFKRALRVPTVQRAVSLATLKIPIIGPIVTQLALNRSLRTLGALLKTNVPIIDALGYSGRVAGHIPLAIAYEQIRIAVGNGATLSEAMSATGAFPKMVVQMTAVGERSGRVSELIATTTEHSEMAVERKIKTAVSLLEPLVIVGMGIVVGMITLSILMPLFSISNNVN